MKNIKFWDKCAYGSIRQKVAEFVEGNPEIADLIDIAYCDFEDALISFIYENREMIAKEVDLEYQRDDVLSQIEKYAGSDIGEFIQDIPLELIDDLIEKWQNELGVNDDYWERYWTSLADVISDGGLSPLAGIEHYTNSEISNYIAYLNEWYSLIPFDSFGKLPPSIEDFFLNEIENETLKDY